jgi:hypothetical protein
VVVLSRAACNAKTRVMVCCPMTTKTKNYPFEVPAGARARSWQIRSRASMGERRAERKAVISEGELAEVARQSSDGLKLLTERRVYRKRHPFEVGPPMHSKMPR